MKGALNIVKAFMKTVTARNIQNVKVKKTHFETVQTAAV
jgi:hypothetical protein